MKIVLFVASLICFVVSEQGKRIVGGYPASPVQASYTVALVYDTAVNPPKPGYFCAGSIIDNDFVLTSASCLRDIYTTSGRNYDVGRNSFIVIVNHPNLTQNAGNAKEFDVDDIYIYNSYSFITGAIGDIALIRTNDNLLQGTGATRVYLADSETVSYGLEDPGRSATVAGWGVMTPDSSSGEYASYLTSADVNLVDNPTCQGASPGFTLTNNYMCAGALLRGSCVGDEGAPLVVQTTIGGTTYNLQVGIASFQSSTTQPRCDGSYGVYTRVSQFKNWIETFTGNLPSVPAPTTTGVNTGVVAVTTGVDGNTTSAVHNDSPLIAVSAILVFTMAFFI